MGKKRSEGRFGGAYGPYAPVFWSQKEGPAYFRPREVQTALKISSILPVPLTLLRIPFLP
jgi:hypothetical protein